MLTIEGIAHKVGKKSSNPDVIAYVKATNEYRKMFPQLLKVATEDFNCRKHRRLVKEERKLHRIQKRTGIKLGILAPDPDNDKENKNAINWKN